MEQVEPRVLDALAYLECFLASLCFVLLKLLGSPYGRYAPQWPGLRVSARVAWVVQELPSLAWPLYECGRATAERLHHWPSRVLLAMFLVHYMQREQAEEENCDMAEDTLSRKGKEVKLKRKDLKEKDNPKMPAAAGLGRTLIFPFLIRGGKPTPVYSCALAFVFCAYNGYLQSRYLSQYAVYPDNWLTDPRFLSGFALWFLGMLINIHSDHILRNLRRPGETGYKIPRGGLFEFVTAANYFGEVTEWCGFALASWSLQGSAFAMFTFCVLLTRAEQHHQWYLEKFEDYPKFRKILIPFLF